MFTFSFFFFNVSLMRRTEMLKSCLWWFAICFVATLLVASAVSFCQANIPCTCQAQVCDFVIDPTHVCLNGAGSNSTMPEAGSRPFDYRPTNPVVPCGMVWYVGDWITFPTFSTCGTAVTDDCT